MSKKNEKEPLVSYKCRLCGKGSIYKSELEKHLIRSHKRQELVDALIEDITIHKKVNLKE